MEDPLFPEGHEDQVDSLAIDFHGKRFVEVENYRAARKARRISLDSSPQRSNNHGSQRSKKSQRVNGSQHWFTSHYHHHSNGPCYFVAPHHHQDFHKASTGQPLSLAHPQILIPVVMQQHQGQQWYYHHHPQYLYPQNKENPPPPPVPVSPAKLEKRTVSVGEGEMPLLEPFPDKPLTAETMGAKVVETVTKVIEKTKGEEEDKVAMKQDKQKDKTKGKVAKKKAVKDEKAAKKKEGGEERRECAKKLRRDSMESEILAAEKNDPEVCLGEDFVPGNWDVVCGRGKNWLEHISNRRFRLLVAIYLPQYETIRRTTKSIVINTIVATIQNAGGQGFVKQKEGSSSWYRISSKDAHEKVSHCLRDCLQPYPQNVRQKWSDEERRLKVKEAQNNVFKSLELLK
ncbi:expressed unknown protein [Seminavis robusta]|uniref:DUF6824 domain-containing protein n=1 Tax=Seminavis robusta TaxID=568900 RepID=A0A9N8H639_9STRA|nr:expressed unknown protein [Seminavis robusta]|eukprot:Sro36_g022750.1 n/a (400) ;mRNA; r:42531-43823